jgi:hypothetical protein
MDARDQPIIVSTKIGRNPVIARRHRSAAISAPAPSDVDMAFPAT